MARRARPPGAAGTGGAVTSTGSRPPGTVALVDYGAGNLRSVENALREVGAAVVVTHDPEVVRRADRVVVPGQGAMPACAEAMRRSGVEAALREVIARGTPVLGICVGLQILFTDGEEAGGARGLDLVPGTVRKLPPEVRLPHIGWSRLAAAGPSACGGRPPGSLPGFLPRVLPGVPSRTPA